MKKISVRILLSTIFMVNVLDGMYVARRRPIVSAQVPVFPLGSAGQGYRGYNTPTKSSDATQQINQENNSWLSSFRNWWNRPSQPLPVDTMTRQEVLKKNQRARRDRELLNRGSMYSHYIKEPLVVEDEQGERETSPVPFETPKKSYAIKEAYRKLLKKLNIEEQDTPEDAMRRKYREKLKENHPDRTRTLSPRDREARNQYTVELIQLYNNYNQTVLLAEKWQQRQQRTRYSE